MSACTLWLLRVQVALTSTAICIKCGVCSGVIYMQSHRAPRNNFRYALLHLHTTLCATLPRPPPPPSPRRHNNLDTQFQLRPPQSGKRSPSKHSSLTQRMHAAASACECKCGPKKDPTLHGRNACVCGACKSRPTSSSVLISVGHSSDVRIYIRLYFILCYNPLHKGST